MNEYQLVKLRFRLLELVTDADRRMHMEPTAERVAAFEKKVSGDSNMRDC